VFFNAKNIGDAWYFISHLFVNIEFKLSGNRLIFDTPGFLLALFAFSIVFLSEALQERGTNLEETFLRQPRWVRWMGYYALITLIFVYSGLGNTFVYLQF
jgi:hypothetical protein